MQENIKIVLVKEEMEFMASNTNLFIAISIIIAFVAFGFAFWLYHWVTKQPSSNARIAQIGDLIKDGANTFLSKEYSVLTKFVLGAAVLIFLFLPKPVWANPNGIKIGRAHV